MTFRPTKAMKSHHSYFFVTNDMQKTTNTPSKSKQTHPPKRNRQSIKLKINNLHYLTSRIMSQFKSRKLFMIIQNSNTLKAFDVDFTLYSLSNRQQITYPIYLSIY